MQLTLFYNDICDNCNHFKVYDESFQCETCLCERAYLECKFWDKNGFIDYSDAVQNIGEEKYEVLYNEFVNDYSKDLMTININDIVDIGNGTEARVLKLIPPTQYLAKYSNGSIMVESRIFAKLK